MEAGAPRGRRRLRALALWVGFGVLPSLCAVVVGILVITRGGPPPIVVIREAGGDVGSGTSAEAVDAVEARAGFRIVLLTILPLDDYYLGYVDLPRPADAGRTGAVSFAYRHASDATSSFSVSQTAPHALNIPPNLPPSDASAPGASIWWSGELIRLSADPSVLRLRVLMRSQAFDQVITFEGARFPSKEAAFAMIESMLRHDDAR